MSRLVVWVVGDVHAEVEGLRVPTAFPFVSDDLLRGGLVNLLGAVASRCAYWQENAPDTSFLLLHAGDILGETGPWGRHDHGVTAASLLHNGVETILPGVAVISTLGNHDAKFGLDTFAETHQELSPVVRCCNIEWVRHPDLSGVLEFEVGGRRVGLFTVTHQSIQRHFMEWGTPEAPTCRWDAAADSDAARAPLEWLLESRREGKLDLAIGLTHLDARAVTRLPLLRALDLVVMAHDHEFFPSRRDVEAGVDNLINCGAFGLVLGEARFDGSSLAGLSLFGITGDERVGHDSVLAAYASASEKVYGAGEAELSRPVAWLDQDLIEYTSPHSRLFEEERPVGRLWAAALRHAGYAHLGRGSGAVIGMIWSGHFRKVSLAAAAMLGGTDAEPFDESHAILASEVMDCCPDENAVILIEVGLPEFVELVREGCAVRGTRMPHFDGFSCLVSEDQVRVSVNSSPQPRVWLATSEYIAEEARIGGLSLSRHASRRISTGITVYEAMIRYCEEMSFVQRKYLEIPPPVLPPATRSAVARAAPGGLQVTWGSA